MFDIGIATCSDRGGRASNEDALRAGATDSTWFVVLSDGAGGHARGAEASRRVVAHIEAALGSGHAPFAPELLSQALLSAHAELQRGQVGAEGRERMHATVVVLWIDGQTDSVLWSHVGDSRLYRIRYGNVELLTADDSVVQRMLDGGVLTAQQAQDHPMKNQLLAAIGMQDGIDPHTLPQAVALEDGDVFLLCSDGWWGLLGDIDMTDTLFAAASPAEWLDAMKALIRERGAAGHDNFSAVAVWAFDPSETTQTEDSETTVISPLWTG